MGENSKIEWTHLLVWSWNDHGAHTIALALRSKGINARVQRFDGTVKLSALIAEMLG